MNFIFPSFVWNYSVSRGFINISRTMYQPFNRRGFGNQSESAVQGQGHADMNNNTHYVKTYPNSNGKVHPKRRSPRPHRDHNGHCKYRKYGNRKSRAIQCRNRTREKSLLVEARLRIQKR